MSEEYVRILLNRHGESVGNVDPEEYIKQGDSKVGLTEQGWHQEIRTGGFLGSYYRRAGVTNWPMIHVSPHQRTLESLSGILHGMGNVFAGEPALHPQSFLVERFFGAISALRFSNGKLPKEMSDGILDLSRRVNRNDSYTAKPPLGESPKETMMAAKLMMETLGRDMAEGKREFLLVTHGAVIQAMVMNWLHVLPQDRDKIGNPGNGDVIEILGTPKNWKFTRIWDGEKGIQVSDDLRAQVKRFTVSDLPPVPDFLKNTP